MLPPCRHTSCREALAISLKVLGNDHVDTATCQNNLGELLINLNLMGEAEPLLQSALVTRRALLGTDHPGACVRARVSGWVGEWFDGGWVGGVGGRVGGRVSGWADEWVGG